MRVIEANQFIEFRKRLDKRLTMFFSVVFGGITFLFFLFSDFLTAMIAGVAMFVFVYALLYVLRGRVSKNIESKRQKVEDEGTMLDVEFRGENGYLIVTEKALKFVTLTKFSDNKSFELEINEDLFISIGEIKYNRIRKLKYGVLVRCSIDVKSMPHGVFYGFTFFDIDGALKKMVEALDKVNQFNLEKHSK